MSVVPRALRAQVLQRLTLNRHEGAMRPYGVPLA
jgi:hypothetical protein